MFMQLTLTLCICNWYNVYCCKGSNIGSAIWPSGHTDHCLLVQIKVDIHLLHLFIFKPNLAQIGNDRFT